MNSFNFYCFILYKFYFNLLLLSLVLNFVNVNLLKKFNYLLKF